MATVFNLADKTTNIMLSNSNRTATGGASAGSEGVRSIGVTHAVVGKWYMEFTNCVISGSGFLDVGVAFSGDTLSSRCQCGVACGSPANVYRNGGGTVVLDTTSNGNTVCIAVDFDNAQIWARINGGIWNNSASANPSTNVGGLSISGITPGTPLMLFASLQNAGATATMNAGSASFNFAVPANFNGWDQPVPTPPHAYGQVVC